MLLALGVAACASTSPHNDAAVVPIAPATGDTGKETPFAQHFDVPSTPTDPATLEPPVSLTMQSYSTRWRVVVSVDAQGLAALEVMGRSGDIPRAFVLPFSEPVVEVSAYGESDPMFCARTQRGTLECLREGVRRHVQKGTIATIRAFRITPPRPVVALEPGYALCYELEGGERQCWDIRRTTSYDRLQLRERTARPRRPSDSNVVRSLDSYHRAIRTPSEVPGATCTLASGEVTCSGVNAYGVLGHGPVDMNAREGKVSGLSGVEHIISGDHFACALDAAGLVSCWGDVPRALLTQEQRQSAPRHAYPSCPVDMEASTRQWEERVRDEQARADASAIDPPCQEPNGPCALPLDPMPVPHDLVPVVEAPCVPVYGFQDRWPTPEELEAMVKADSGVYTFTEPVALAHLGEVRIMAIDLASPNHESRRVCFSTTERRVFCRG